MEFMALPGFTPAHHKSVPLGDRLAVAEAEAAAPGPEGQQPCHRVGLAGRIDQLACVFSRPGGLWEEAVIMRSDGGQGVVGALFIAAQRLSLQQAGCSVPVAPPPAG